MKKKVLISLSLIMALCLTACSGGTAPANASSNTSAIDTSVEDFTEDDTEAAPEDDIDEEAETIAADETENSEYMKQRGVAGYVDEKNIYINEFFGISSLPYPGYGYLSDEIIGYTGNASSAHLDEETITETLDSYNQLVEFVFSDTMMHNYSTVILSKMADDLTMEDVESRIDETVPIMTESYERQGYKDLVCEKTQVTFLGEDTYCIKVAGDYDGTELNLVMVFLIRDGYCATVTVQAETEEKINQLISLFVPIQ